MSVELSTYISLLYACIICIFSYLSDLSYDLFGREALPGGGSVISRRELFVKDLAQNLQILAESRTAGPTENILSEAYEP